jgi:hypothetical protein
MMGGVADGKIFKPLARDTIQKARRGGKYPRVRWWGEMVNVLYVDGNGKGSNRLEEFFDEVAHEETIAIFCSFLMDKYDPLICDEAFRNVCRTHSHAIPAEDYVTGKQLTALSRRLSGRSKGKSLRSLKFVEWCRIGNALFTGNAAVGQGDDAAAFLSGARKRKTVRNCKPAHPQ